MFFFGTRAVSSGGVRRLAGARRTPAAVVVSRSESTARIPEMAAMWPALKTHDDWYRLSIEQPDGFWGCAARSTLSWAKDFETVMQCDMKAGRFEWFGKGELNASVNCVDRHADQNPNKTALIWEKDQPGDQELVSYKDLSRMVNKMANVLMVHGVQRGDVVALYMPVSPMAVATMLACARIGAIHSVIFAGFSAQSLRTRIQDMKAVAVVTADEAVRAGKKIPLRSTVAAALADRSCPSVRNVFVMQRTNNMDCLKPGDILLSEAMASVSQTCPAVQVKSDDYLFVLYTSGSTGSPKGVAHSTAGYLLYTAFSHKHVFNYSDPNDVFGCVADIGWITGHSYVVYGPLVNGGTTLLFESTPNYPDPGRYWETVERLKINQFYAAPTALRMLLRHDSSYVTKYDRSSLKTLGSVGEPINQEAWQWFHDVVGEGRCDLVDTWWQTETGGIALAPRPSPRSAAIVPAKPMRPFFGIEPALLDDQGRELAGNDVHGSLCIKKPWPGMARTIFNSHDRFIQTYLSTFPGYYFSGDGAYRDAEGHLQITGRVDDVINVTGHRLGTAEVEDALDSHELVAETAVVGYPHEVKGEGIYAYVILKESAVGMEPQQRKIIEDELRIIAKNKISGFAVPDKIQICSGLPKTRSGKIMRRILRKVAANQVDDLGDVSTLADPGIVQELITNHNKL